MARRMPSASSSHKASTISPLRQARTRHMLGRSRVLLYTLPALTPQRARPVRPASSLLNPFRLVLYPRSLARITSLLPTGLHEASIFRKPRRRLFRSPTPRESNASRPLSNTCQQQSPHPRKLRLKPSSARTQTIRRKHPKLTTAASYKPVDTERPVPFCSPSCRAPISPPPEHCTSRRKHPVKHAED